MLIVKGSRTGELHDNYKNVEKKNCSALGGCFLLFCYEMGSLEGGEVVGGEWEVGYGKIRVWIKQGRGPDYWKRTGILAAT